MTSTDIIMAVILSFLATATLGYILYLMYIDIERRQQKQMKVVKRGKIPTKKVQCQNCHSIIEYKRMDMGRTHFQTEDYWFLICPICGLTIKIEDWEGEGL